MKRNTKLTAILSASLLLLCAAMLPVPAAALLISASGPTSNLGTAAMIIAAPAHSLDDMVTNSGMQGFNEAQGVLTTVAHTTDGGIIAAGTLVNSHMIFLNSAGGTSLFHYGVSWTFDGMIIGVMSDQSGTLEAASTFELGNPATNYTTTFPGSGPAAPFNARGLETNNGTGLGSGDGYTLLDPYTIRLGMFVTEPGDWIRVVTVADPVPEPSTILLLGSGLIGLVVYRKKRQG